MDKTALELLDSIGKHLDTLDWILGNNATKNYINNKRKTTCHKQERVKLN